MYVKIIHICKSVLKYYNLIFYSRHSSHPLTLPLENVAPFFLLSFFFSFSSFFSFMIVINRLESHLNVDNVRQCVIGQGKGREGEGIADGARRRKLN